MEDEQTGKDVKYWKAMTSVSSVVAVGALLWGLNAYQQVAAFKSELENAHATNQSLLNEANAKINALTTEANEKIQALSKRDLPVIVSFRTSLLGSELIAAFKNTSGSQLEVAGTFSSSATSQTKEISFVVPPNGIKELNASDGWPFAKGQQIKLSNANFRSLEYTVP